MKGSDKASYVKARDTDFSGSKHNFDVFLGELRTSPLKSLFLAGLCTLLGVFMFHYPHEGSVIFSSSWSIWIPAVLSVGMALWFLILGIRGLIRK